MFGTVGTRNGSGCSFDSLPVDGLPSTLHHLGIFFFGTTRHFQGSFLGTPRLFAKPLGPSRCVSLAGYSFLVLKGNKGGPSFLVSPHGLQYKAGVPPKTDTPTSRFTMLGACRPQAFGAFGAFGFQGLCELHWQLSLRHQVGPHQRAADQVGAPLLYAARGGGPLRNGEAIDPNGMGTDQTRGWGRCLFGRWSFWDVRFFGGTSFRFQGKPKGYLPWRGFLTAREVPQIVSCMVRD